MDDLTRIRNDWTEMIQLKSLEWFKRLIAAHCFIENSYINLKMENYLIILGSAKRPHSASDPFIKVSTVSSMSYPRYDTYDGDMKP